MKQTAVQWLLNEFASKFDIIKNNLPYIQDVVEKAREMERQQMIEMHDKGFDSVEQLNGEFAIEFAEWIRVCKMKGRPYDFENTKELLVIYKKEKGL
jgi:hypothetical protein